MGSQRAQNEASALLPFARRNGGDCMSAQTHRDRLLILFGQTGEILEDFVASRTPEEQQDKSMPEGWSAKDLLTVIAFWMDYIVERMSYYQRGEEPPHEVDFEAVQAQALASSAKHVWREEAASVRRALAALTAAVERSSETLLETYNYYRDGDGGPFWGEIRANGFLVPMQECEKYLRRIGDSGRADEVLARLAPIVGEQARVVCDLAQPEEIRNWQLQAARAPLVIDVRGAADFARGHVPGAWHLPLALLAQQTGRLPTDRPIVTYCDMHHPGQSRGERAASLLSMAGFQAMALAGGYPAWEAAGLPVETAHGETA
jgi:rhodanese-related sulfurtransferase